MTDLGLSLSDLLTYASIVATFVVEQGVRFCFPVGPTISGRKRVELVKNTKMGLFTVGGGLWRRIESAGLDPRLILLSSEEKFHAFSLFSAHSVVGMFLWWKIWKKEQYAAADKKRDVYVTVVSDGRASRRYVSLPVQHVSRCSSVLSSPQSKSCIKAWAASLAEHPFDAATYDSEFLKVYANTRLSIEVGSTSAVLVPVDPLTLAQRMLIERVGTAR